MSNANCDTDFVGQGLQILSENVMAGVVAGSQRLKTFHIQVSAAELQGEASQIFLPAVER